MKFAFPVIAISAAREEAVALEETPDTGESAERMSESLNESNCCEATQLLEERLRKYIDEKEYCQKDVPAGILVDSFGTNLTFFRQYMKERYGMDLRPWRKELRLREAARLFGECPEYSIDKVCEMVGYNDNGNFNRDFKKMTGMTPKRYCQQIYSNITVSPHEEREIPTD